MQFALKLLTAATLVATGSASHAIIYTYTGDTTGAPTFNRPLGDLSGLSFVGSAVNYDAFEFSVSAAGNYTFLTTADFDSFLILYSPSFDPSNSLSNALVANDDLLPGFTTSGFVYTLNTGTSYVLVNTSFANGEAGNFSTTIGGPGAVTPVPEPAAYALMALGLLAVGAAKWRQSSRA